MSKDTHPEKKKTAPKLSEEKVLYPTLFSALSKSEDHSCVKCRILFSHTKPVSSRSRVLFQIPENTCGLLPMPFQS